MNDAEPYTPSSEAHGINERPVNMFSSSDN